MRLLLKTILVLGVTLAILIPLGLINDTIGERQAYRDRAVASIARSYAGNQAFAGPVLVVPYRESVEVEERDEKGAARKVRRTVDGRWTFFPATLRVQGHIKPDTRQLGLHKVRVYEWQGQADAGFRARIPADSDPAHPRSIGRPWLGYAIADVRGLLGAPRLRIDGRDVALQEGFGAREGGGVHARLTAAKAGAVLAFDTQLAFALGGTETLALVPLAKDNRFTLESAWPHPRFGGSFLPRERRVDAQGFRARWEISSLATGAQAQFLAGRTLPQVEAGGTSDDLRGGAASQGMAIDAGGVSLVDPVNIYSQADRATKYGVLFVLLTFVGFFMFELIRQLPIHPIQYGLVGLALAIFFLLLVSLSEHIAFGVAYLASSAACIGLLGVYLSAVLRSVARGCGFALMLTVLYAALYGLLVSEDNALVLGAGLLFAILAAIMLVTRKVDWYALTAKPSAPA